MVKDRIVGLLAVALMAGPAHSPAQDAYVSRLERALQKDRAVQAARRDALKRQLAAPGLSETERGLLAARLDDATRMLDALAAPAGDPQELQAARDQVAAAFIRQWKINRALHRQYGGRIIFQQGGPEPLDAYRRFLEEHQARGDFVFLDKDLEAAFWRYYRTDAIHSFFPPGSNAEAQAFATPPRGSRRTRITPGRRSQRSPPMAMSSSSLASHDRRTMRRP